jgi:hypothetical protein
MKGFGLVSRMITLAALLAVAAISPVYAQALPDAPGLGRAIAAQERHSDALLLNADIVGTGVGLTRGGEPAVMIFAARADVGGLPRSLDGVPVVVRVTGRISALSHKEGHSQGGGSGGGGGIDPTQRFERPVPIGVSTGNSTQCTSGTIGARVVDGLGNLYALSNNHVFALENGARIGDSIVQPGRFDTNCVVDLANDVVAVLDDYVEIVFSETAVNTVDAAIALTSGADLGTATPADGYGTPGSVTLPPAVGMAVQKYGRNSSLTRGEITAINATVRIDYIAGTATFVEQIVVESSGPFLKSGDSGSLLVAEDGFNSPVGLLFAGNRSGKFAVANDIENVLTSFGVTIDGQ